MGDALSARQLAERPLAAEVLNHLGNNEAARGRRLVVTDRLCSSAEQILDLSLASPDHGGLRAIIARTVWARGLPLDAASATVQSFPPNALDVARVVESWLAPALETPDWVAFCVAERPGLGGYRHVALFQATFPVWTDAIPRSLTSSTTLAFEARLPPQSVASAPPVLLVGTPGGEVIRSELSPVRDHWVTRLPLDAHSGIHWLNLSVPHARSRRLVLSLPVFLRVPVPPRAPEVRATLPRTEPPTSDVPALLIEVLNTERAKLGLDPLRPDDTLMMVADEAARRLVGPSTVRTSTASIDAERNFDNIAQAWGQGMSIEEIAGRLLQLPFYRSAYLDERASHVGIGVAEEQDKADFFGHAIVVGSLPPVIDVEEARARLYQEIDHARQRRGHGPARRDRRLTSLAQEEAQGLCRSLEGEKRKEDLADLVSEISSRIQDLPAVRRYASPTELSSQIDHPERIHTRLPDSIIEAARPIIGIGVCQGDFPKVGRRRAAVLFLVVRDQRKRPAAQVH